MKKILKPLQDPEYCAKCIQLVYWTDHQNGILRKKWGRGFTYVHNGERVEDTDRRAYLDSLPIPPAWQEVMIAPKERAHILAVGTDKDGRRQYLYHPKWMEYRKLLDFYKLIPFGKALPKIRGWIRRNVKKPHDSEEHALAGLLLALDDTSIRIGNEHYHEEHGTVGLTTLQKKHVNIEGDELVLKFPGKSGEHRVVSSKKPTLVRFFQEAKRRRGSAIFPDTTPDKVNLALEKITGYPITAKDFRTWNGTLWAFKELSHTSETPKNAEQTAIEQTATKLGNTKGVAKKSYVHPHVLEAFEDPSYQRYFRPARKPKKSLSPHELQLVRLLKRLYKERF